MAYDRFRDEKIRKLGTKLISESAVEQGGLSGREVELPISYRIWRLRLFFVGKRAYYLLVAAPKFLENQRRFLDSFRLATPRGEAKPEAIRVKNRTTSPTAI